MENNSHLTRENFLECNWDSNIPQDEHYGYSSIMRSLQASAKNNLDEGKADGHKILELLSKVASMMLVPSSINEPYKPIVEDLQLGRRSLIPDDLIEDELSFFEIILDDVNEPFLKARLADLLWLLKTRRNPNYAKVAIDSYTSIVINEEVWNRGVNVCWERAAQLSMQLRDYERLGRIKSELFSAFLREYPDQKFMNLWIADLMHRLKMDRDIHENLATSLFEKAETLKDCGDFNAARSYYELSAKQFQKCSLEDQQIKCLYEIAQSFEFEANLSEAHNNLLANSYYENSIHAYRKIPAKYRETYDVENKVLEIRAKKTTSGQASLDEMVMIKTKDIDVSELAKSAVQYVAGKANPHQAIVYFTNLYKGPSYNHLVENSKATIQDSFFSNLFTKSKMSPDGRIVAKIPGISPETAEDDPAMLAVLDSKLHEHFSFEVQLAVQARIIPALRQLCNEHRFTQELLTAICDRSPFVPQDRVHLMGYALWLGFEENFGFAVHLLCPLLEHIVRIELKSNGAHTTTIDSEGIENENGLSTLMKLAEAIPTFGENLAFEIKSIFTESLGYNLRNEVAHGLLNDDSANSVVSIYAWWMILRLVVMSLRTGQSISK